MPAVAHIETPEGPKGIVDAEKGVVVLGIKHPDERGWKLAHRRLPTSLASVASDRTLTTRFSGLRLSGG